MIQVKHLIPLTFLVANSVQAVTPKITKISVTPESAPAGTKFKFTATLNAPLTTGNKIKINLGKGLASMTGKNTSYSLSRAIYAIGSQTYKVGIYNSKNVLQSESNNGSYTVTGTTQKTTGYTKIANDGSELPDSATLGTKQKDWACTKDNKTGLIWEVKTYDGGLHDVNNTYTWYEPDAKKSGYEGYQKDCKGSECNTYAFTNAVNSQFFCGANDWRMPTLIEQQSLVSCSSDISNMCASKPSGDWISDSDIEYWSSLPAKDDPLLFSAMYTVFSGKYSGQSFNDSRHQSKNVRLVRNSENTIKPNHAPTLTLVSSDSTAMANKKYTVTLNAKDADANLDSVTVNWGDGTTPETLTAIEGKNLVFSHVYASIGAFNFSAFAVDKAHSALKSNEISNVVTVEPLVITYSVAQSYDKFKNLTSYKGLTLNVNGDILDSTNIMSLIQSTSFIRAWKFSDNSIAYQIYISSLYSWGWRYYNSIYDSNGVSAKLTEIDSSVFDCGSYSCKYNEVVGASVTREYLESNKETGLEFKISGSGGEEIYKIPADYIKAILAAVPAG